MKASALREQTIEGLESEAVELAQQLFKLRFQQATGQLENPGKLRAVRRDLARVKTVLTEKKKAAQRSA